MRARQPADGAGRDQGPAARGGPPGSQHLHPHAVGVRLSARGRQVQLGLRNRARARDGRAPDRVPARTRHRRIVVDQRHGLHPRSCARLRRLGGSEGPRAVVVRALPSLLQEGRNAPRGQRRLPRRRRPALRHHRRDEESALSRVHRGRRAGRLRAHRGHERLPAGRPRSDGKEHLPRPPLERGDGVPAAGPRAPRPGGRIAHARHARAVRGQARDWRRIRAARTARPGARPARGDRRGRGDQLAADPDALRHRQR